MKLFRILDPFTITLITVVLLASFSRPRVALYLSLKATTAAIALYCFICTGRSFHVKPLLPAVVTGVYICG